MAQHSRTPQEGPALDFADREQNLNRLRGRLLACSGSGTSSRDQATSSTAGHGDGAKACSTRSAGGTWRTQCKRGVLLGRAGRHAARATQQRYTHAAPISRNGATCCRVRLLCQGKELSCAHQGVARVQAHPVRHQQLP